LNVSIQAPGRGSQLATCGNRLAARYGSAMPTPSMPNTASACHAGNPKAKPSDAPMKGAVQGEAIPTASTPDKNASTCGFFACNEAKEEGSTLANSNTPSKFSAINVNSKAKSATTSGDCN
jgi:hypothetical protein